MTRREYGTGGLHQRRSDWRWIGTLETGWTTNGTRRRHTVSNKGCHGGCAPRCKHRAEIKRKLRDKRLALDRGDIGTSDRTTIHAWAKTYLAVRRRDLTPKAYNAAASPIRKWIVPTIGHRRLVDLTPADVRAVHDACRNAGKQAADVHRVMRTMLEAAIAEGHPIAPRVLKVKAPAAPKSDRQAMTVDEGLACIKAAGDMPNGVRWLFTLLYGQRMGECLGLTWDAVDYGAGAFGEVVIEWQLQSLPYVHGCAPEDADPECGHKLARSCPTRRFRVPDDHESRHLVDAYHLVRPKSRAGYRVAPLLEPVRDALQQWQKVAPESPYGLVWPEANGRPMNDKHDRAEWHALQARAKVAHPAGRPYHVHECRNFAATMLLEADVPEHVVTDLLGHSSVATSLRYRTRRREPLLEAMQRVGERLQLG